MVDAKGIKSINRKSELFKGISMIQPENVEETPEMMFSAFAETMKKGEEEEQDIEFWLSNEIEGKDLLA